MHSTLTAERLLAPEIGTKAAIECTVAVTPLMPDTMDSHILPIPLGTVNITWSNVVGDGQGQRRIAITYSKPTHLDWSSRDTVPQPIETMRLDFDPRTTNGRLTPIFRS